LWKGTINATTAKTIGNSDMETTAVRNTFGKGEVIWVPSLIGLGARNKGEYGPLSSLLSVETAKSLNNVPFRFSKHQPGMLMKTMQSGEDYITIIINKSAEKRNVPLIVLRGNSKSSLLFADKGGSVNNKTITISPEETIVIHWSYSKQKSVNK
jgi:beta-galactosidase